MPLVAAEVFAIVKTRALRIRVCTIEKRSHERIVAVPLIGVDARCGQRHREKSARFSSTWRAALSEFRRLPSSPVHEALLLVAQLFGKRSFSVQAGCSWAVLKSRFRADRRYPEG